MVSMKPSATRSLWPSRPTEAAAGQALRASCAKRLPHPPALLPVFAHLAIVLMLGIYVPPYLADWYRAAARLIGGE